MRPSSNKTEALRLRWKRRASTGCRFAHLAQAGLGYVKLVFVKELGAHNKIFQQYVLMCSDSTFRNAQVYRAHESR
jgi:hypothetical protein